MRSIKPIAFGIFVTFSVFCAVLYSSCKKDASKGVTCLHYATKSGSICDCRKGTGGVNCETEYRRLYKDFKYRGTSTYSTPTYNINGADSNNLITFTAENDTFYTKARIIWDNSSVIRPISLPVIFNNGSSNGSNYTIVETPIDTFTYSGTVSINGATLSATITKVRPNGVKTLVMINDFNKQ